MQLMNVNTIYFRIYILEIRFDFIMNFNGYMGLSLTFDGGRGCLNYNAERGGE